MFDGGQGFTKAQVANTGGKSRSVEVMGPVREIFPSHFGFLGGTAPKTAVVEMAAAAGLSLVPHKQRNPLHTTTYGVGHLVKTALDEGATDILLGCGDSGTCDGDIGMAQALGARFFDSKGGEVPIAQRGASLSDLAAVDLSALHPRLSRGKIYVACNWHNVLCGPKGVARVFGPQKGATLSEVELLDIAMIRVGVVLCARKWRIRWAERKLHLIGAQLHPRYDIITKFLNVNNLIQHCDVVITAEGGIDEQIPRGNIPAEVARIAKSRGVPVIALAGTVGRGASCNYEAGIDAFASIPRAPVTLRVAIAEAERLLIEAAESVIRMVVVGWSLRRFCTPSPLRPAGESAMAFERSGTFY